MTTRRTISLVLTLALAGTLVFPAAAAPFSGPTDQVDSDLQIAPSSDYAALEDGELVVDISASNPAIDGAGVNPDARTTFADVFRIRYTGSQYAEVWVTHDSPAISFTVAGQPVDSRANNVSLAPNESVPVTLVVDTTVDDLEGAIENLTLHSRLADPETVAAADDTSGDPPGRSVIRSAGSRYFTVFGTARGGVTHFDVDRMVLDRVDGQTLALETVTAGTTGGSLSMAVDTVDTETASAVVQAGSEPLGGANVSVETGAVTNGTLRFSVSAGYFEARNVSPANLVVYRQSEETVSRLDVTTTGAENGRVTFAAETDGFSTFVLAVDRPRLRIDDASLDRTTIEPGQDVDVTVTIRNVGNANGERPVRVTVDDTVVAERTVDLEPGETTALTIPVAPDTTGKHRVAVNGVDAGTVVVESATTEPTTTETATPTTTTGDEEATPTETMTPTGTMTPTETVAPTPSDTEPTTAATAAPTSATPTDGPVEEPGGFGLERLLGLVVLLVALLATVTLARRVT